MNKNSFIKFVITVFLINFIFINPIFSANYEFVQQKIKELREGDLSKKLKAIEILGALSSNANFAVANAVSRTAFASAIASFNKLFIEFSPLIKIFGNKVIKNLNKIVYNIFRDSTLEVLYTCRQL